MPTESAISYRGPRVIKQRAHTGSYTCDGWTVCDAEKIGKIQSLG